MASGDVHSESDRGKVARPYIFISRDLEGVIGLSLNSYRRRLLVHRIPESLRLESEWGLGEGVLERWNTP